MSTHTQAVCHFVSTRRLLLSFCKQNATSLSEGGSIATRLRVASIRCMAGRPISSTLVCSRYRVGLCPKMKYHPLCGWIFIDVEPPREIEIFLHIIPKTLKFFQTYAIMKKPNRSNIVTYRAPPFLKRGNYTLFCLHERT